MRRERPKELAAAICANPQFFDAARRFTTEYLAWRVRLGVLNKVLSNLGRERLLEHVLYLHFGRAEHGATFERLASLSAARDQIGARAARTALRLAQIAGLVTLARSPDDGRLRIIEPAEPLLALTSDVYAMGFRIFDRLAPSGGLSAQLNGEPDFLTFVLTRMGRAFLMAEFQPGRKPDVFNSLLRLEGGRPIMATAVDRHWRGQDLPTSQELSRQFYVSASQTRAVLKQAESLGIIRTAARGRLLDAAPLVELYLDALCETLALYAEHALDMDETSFSRSNATT